MYLSALYRITAECFVLIFCVCVKGDAGGLVWREGAQLDSDHRWNRFCTPWCHAWGTWEPTCLCLCPCECVFLAPSPFVLVFWVWMRVREMYIWALCMFIHNLISHLHACCLVDAFLWKTVLVRGVFLMTLNCFAVFFKSCLNVVQSLWYNELIL